MPHVAVVVGRNLFNDVVIDDEDVGRYNHCSIELSYGIVTCLPSRDSWSGQVPNETGARIVMTNEKKIQL